MKIAAAAFKVFLEDLYISSRQEVEHTILLAGLTVVEFRVCEALFIHKENPASAIHEVNNQIRFCSLVVDGDGEAMINPASDIHPVLWKNVGRILGGLPLE